MLDKANFFLKAVEHGSISAAATEMNISTSTGSRWIQDLETELGVSLMIKTTRRISLTDLGEEFYSEYSKVQKTINSLFERITSTDNEMKGVIKIASTPLYTQHFLSQIIGEFLTLNPDVSFKIIDTAHSDNLSDEVDFIIKAHATYLGYLEKDNGLIKRLLIRYPLVTVSSPSYIKLHGRPSTPDELINHCCLYAATLVGGNHWQYEYKNKITLTPITPKVEIENSIFIKSVVVNGGGIAYLPEPIVVRELEQGSLVPLLTQYTKSEFELSIYYQPKIKMPIRAQKFKDFLIKRTKELQTSVFGPE